MDLQTICIVCMKPLTSSEVGGSVEVEEGGESVKCLICRPCFYPKNRADEFAKLNAPLVNLRRLRHSSESPV